MVAIAEKPKKLNTFTYNTSYDFEDFDSVETLMKDLALIKESEEMGGEIPAEKAYLEGLKFIDNLKI